MKQNLNQTFKMRLLPQNGFIWLNLGDMVQILSLNRKKALAVLSDEDRQTVEVEGGKSCQIVSVNGFFVLVWHYRAVMGIGLAEYLQNEGLPELKTRVSLNPGLKAQS